MKKEADKVNRKSPGKKDFWQEYRAVVLGQGVPKVRAEWFVKWARKFASFVRGVPLRLRTAEHVRAFLSGLGHQVNVEQWQMDQAEEALRMLYQEFLGLAWARRWPDTVGGIWADEAVKGSESTLSLAQQGMIQREGFRDQATSSELDAHHEEVLKRLRTGMRMRHYSLRTEQAYEHWMRRFVSFHGLKSPQELGPDTVREYLEYLAEERKVSASTQNQALNALVVLYEQVLEEPLGMIGDFTRAKRPRRLPVVLTREEVNRLLDALTGTYALMAGLLYGSGLRLMECVRLRVKDVDFA
jgi:hypothetical protein